MLDRLLLVSCICIVVALILFFFYWNRFLGFALGLVFRLLYWNQESSSCWFEIGSIHFSLLSGRILLKDVHYHSSNQTIKIVKGQIQWRYWIRRPMTEDEINVKGEEYRYTFQIPSCRIQVTLQGFEWFLYNRTAAYENILSQMEDSLNRNVSRSTDRNRSSQKLNRWDSTRSAAVAKRTLRVPATIQQAFAWFRQQLPILDPKDILPLGIQVSKGAIICGNSSTPTLLMAEFSVCQGTFGITRAKSRYDLYKQVLTLQFHNALIHFTENEHYVDPMSTLGELIHGRIDQFHTLRNAPSHLPYRSFRRLWRQLSLYLLTHRYGLNRQHQRNFKTSSKRTRTKRGKTIEEETPIGADFSTLEYAIERKILEAPTLELSYLVDVVGDVPPVEEQTHPEAYEFGNGDISPDWVLELVVHGGMFRYGPWADRQRAELQRIFFPQTYQTTEETRPVEPGDKRIWTALQIFVELRDETTLHIPFREASKDWQWDGVVEVPKRSRRREPASINVTVGDRSSINYLMPMVAGPSGYGAVLEVHLDDIAVTSSLNDIRLVIADSCRVHGNLPSPLKWNDERTWAIDITLRQPVLYLLRDHINMFTDLGKDWASGPPSDWQRWVPVIYQVKLNLHRYELNLYANDQNIIDKPLVREENALVIVHGQRFEIDVVLPSNRFRPESTTVQFTARVPHISIDFSLPRWNTRAAYIPKDGCNLAKTGPCVLKASYQYFSEVRKDFIDHLKIHLEVSELVYRGLGWSIRYWMVLRDNYLGSFTNYSTLYEYIDKRKRKIPLGDPINLKYREGKNNMLQCTVSGLVRGGAVVIPAGILGAKHPEMSTPSKRRSGAGACVVLTFPELQVHLRLHDYFLEISINQSTAFGHIDYSFPESLSYERANVGERILMIDRVDVVANRLFGPLPRTSTYLCIWELNFGHIKLDLSFADAQILAHAGRAFGLSFTDLANAPAAECVPPADPDITFRKVNINSMETIFRTRGVVLQITCDEGVKVDNNDVGGLSYSKFTGLQIPHISSKILLNASVERNTWLEAGEIVTDLYVDIYAAPRGFKEFIEKQRAFVGEQDKLTGRAAKILSRMEGGRVLHRNGVYIPQLQLPSLKMPRTPMAHPRPQKALSALHLQHMSAAGDASESDGEGLISEADRDARLARTRTATPVHVQEEELPMSSGDESDDADLTDGDSTDSEWTDIEDRAPTRDKSLLAYYAHLTTHYVATRRSDPEYWESPSFIVTKGRDRFLGSRLFKSFIVDLERLTTGPVGVAPHPSQDSDTIRLHSKRLMEVKLTPLLTSALALFQRDICSIDLGPELKLDSLLAECYSSVVSSIEEKGEARTVLGVSCPGILVHVLQNISMSEEGYPKIVPQLKESHIPSKLDMTTELSLCIRDVDFSHVFSKVQSKTKATIRTASLELDTPSNNRPANSTSGTSIFDWHIHGLMIDSQPSNIRLSWAKSTATICHRGPELLTATSIALKQGVAQILETFRAVKRHNDAAAQKVVHEILRLSDNMTVVDPLSTIQPSYLVQEGTPHRLRTNPTFRFLFHLRDCLSNLQPKDLEHISASQAEHRAVDLEQFQSSLHSRLVTLDQDIGIEQDLSLLENLLKIRCPRGQPAASPKELPSISLELQTTCFRIAAPSGSACNVFSVSGVRTHIRMLLLDLVQHTFNSPANMSQTSIREKGPHIVKRLSTYFIVDDIHFIIYSHLLDFVQHALRVRRIYLSQVAQNDHKKSGVNQPSSSQVPVSITYIDANISLRAIRLQAAAANLTFEIGAKSMEFVSMLSLTPSQGEESLNASLLFDKIYLQAHSPLGKAKQGTDQDILAAFSFTKGRVNSVMRRDLDARSNTKVVLSLGGLHLSVPRSALKLYRFVEEWRADFLPGIESTFKAVLSELQISPEKLHSPAPSTSSSSRRPLLHVNGQIFQIGISLQVMHGTWLSWEANNVTTYVQSSPTHLVPYNITFGLQIASTVLEISTKENIQDAVPNSRVKLTFPTLSLGGTHDGRLVQTLVIIDYLDLKVKPSHWDTLLVVQQKFGQDFNDFVVLMQDSRLKSASKPQPQRQGTGLKFGGFIKMRGFRIGFEGFSSTMFLECQDIGGGLRSENGGSWDLGLSDLALSLAPRSADSTTQSFSRGRRSVFVIIDLKVLAGKRKAFPYEHTLELVVTKIHAVMQPSSIGEIGDFIDQLQVEILERKEQRALELAAFKQKTQSIMKTFEVKTRDIQTEQTSWLSKYLIGVTIKDLGIAFPITLDQDMRIPKSKTEDTSVRAFLFSISSISFDIKRGETGEAIMKNFSFQFISNFRQSNPNDFSGTKHHTRNRVIYPEMKAQLRTALRANSRQIWVNANVSGFILDLDSTIVDYVFSLVDVYRRGKERLEQLSSGASHAPSSPLGLQDQAAPEKHYASTPTSNVFASLIFQSGKVRMYSSAAAKLYRTRTLSRDMTELTDEQILEIGAEIFSLPVVSVWTEYRATSAPQKLGNSRDQESSILVFKSTVHSSRNTLRPTLLPFLTEVVNHAEARMRKVSVQMIQSPLLSQSSDMVSADREGSLKAVSSMRISFSLRIDRSKLELTCLPDVNVVAGLHWESGGFIVSVSPGARQVTFTGTVGGLSIGLKHGFLSEDCVQLDARNLTFSISFSKLEFHPTHTTNSVSVAVNTEFHGKVKFSRLQDILCFKAVWLDHFPLFNNPSATEARSVLKSSSSVSFITPPNKQSFSTLLLLNVRQINLEVDLGQSISKISLTLNQAVMRTKLTDSMNEAAINVGEVLIVADGNLSGRARVPDCLFQTIRRTDTYLLNQTDGRMLELKLTSGPLIASLESDRQRLLHYHAEPLEVEIYDDWTSTTLANDEENLLHLSFIVTSPEIVAVVTVGTIPKLMSYANKFEANLEAQREGASRESATFRGTRSLKPDNPLSAVAEVMFQTAKTKFREADTKLSHTVRQQMSLQLKYLRLVVFPRSMEDLEMAQFVGRDVRAQLERLVATEAKPAQRDLRLFFSSMAISKYTQTQPVNLPTPGLEEGRTWLEAFVKSAVEAIIVGLPSMRMHMSSEELSEDATKNLVYDFHSSFIRQGMREFDDIYITLNVALYSWLTLLRKNMTREMDQVQATAEWRTTMNPATAPSTTAEKRKRVPDPLNLAEPPRSATLPANIISPLSPFSVTQPRSATTSRETPEPPSVMLQPTTPVPFPTSREPDSTPAGASRTTKPADVKYTPHDRFIERLTMRQLGEATPDVMHPFFMKKAGFNLEDSLPQYVHEYTTVPLEEIMEVLLKLYSRQLRAKN